MNDFDFLGDLRHKLVNRTVNLRLMSNNFEDLKARLSQETLDTKVSGHPDATITLSKALDIIKRDSERLNELVTLIDEQMCHPLVIYVTNDNKAEGVVIDQRGNVSFEPEATPYYWDRNDERNMLLAVHKVIQTEPDMGSAMAEVKILPQVN